jgi:hypothetical protein
MRIGFTNLYSWRPHVEHAHFLAELARHGGHAVSFLTCDADLESCYAKALRPERSDFMHCARCRAGGLRSYVGKAVHSIGALADDTIVLPSGASEWCRSSASTLGRFESDEDFEAAEFQALAASLDGPTRRAHTAALRWIERERLDAICLFNGRIDVTRGVLEAARSAGIPFVSHERTWFGDGLQLLPGENCLGLHSVDRLMREWRDRPLERAQALRAASHVASRFLRRNSKEWRAYNLAASITDWPEPAARHRVLLVPGSRNEVFGHPDWISKWPGHTTAFDALIAHLGLGPADLVLRCHPNWGERIGSYDGHRAERHFTDWAQSRGIRCIASTDPTSTLGLIEQSDAIVVCGGSAALEAGALGKQVIAVAPSIYQQAGFQSDAWGPQALPQLVLHASLDAAERARHAAHIARQTLRFAYTMIYRVPQFVNQVRCITTTRYEYREGADPARLTDLLRTCVLQPDDATYAADARGEDEVLASMAAHDWQTLLDATPALPPAALRPLPRRWLFRPIDRIREAMPRGDL